MTFSDLHRAIYERLTGTGYAVYDTSEKLKYPCFVILSPSAQIGLNKTSDIRDITVQLEVVTDDRQGKLTAYEMLEAAEQALKAPLNLSGLYAQHLLSAGDVYIQQNQLYVGQLTYQFKFNS